MHVFLMVQIMIGAGVDSSGNLVACYLGADYSAAKAAVDAAGVAGTIPRRLRLSEPTSGRHLALRSRYACIGSRRFLNIPHFFDPLLCPIGYRTARLIGIL